MGIERTHPDPIPPLADRPSPWSRPLALATALMFVVSSAFPLVAGLSKDTSVFPRWWGVLDVGIAFLLGIMVIAVVTIGQGRVDERAVADTYRAYRVLIHGILAALVVFFLAGDRVVWPQCLTGFAWRAWLLSYGLPSWFAAFGTATGPRFDPTLWPVDTDGDRPGKM